MREPLRRIGALALTAVLTLSLTGCTDKEAEAAANAAYDKAMREYEQQVKELDELRERAEEAENAVSEYIAAVNATVNGVSFALVDGSAEYTAQAVLPDGMKVDHWLLNGESVDGGESITFAAEGNTVVEAVFRPEKKLTAVNSLMCLVDENEKDISEPFTELNFEDRESVSVRVYAETNDLVTVDHWIINGVAVDINSFILEFYAHDLTEATTFEPVFAACYTQHEAADPTPRYQQVPLSY